MKNPFRYFTGSPEAIRPAVTTYIGYPLSLKRVEDLLFERGIDICHETVRFWWNRFGPMSAAEIRKRRDRRAALKLRKRTMKRHGRARAIVTDRLPPYRAAMKTLQKFAAVHASIHNHFNRDRPLNRRDTFRQNRSAALAEWRRLAA